MLISIIAAIDEKRGIGKNNDLLFRIYEDLKRFRKLTNGHPIIMGRKTFESIGRILPNRFNIIVTRQPTTVTLEKNNKNVAVVTSLDYAISLAKENLQTTQYKLHDTDENEIFIIGGGEIFSQTLPFVRRLYLTIVKGDFGADVFFPEYQYLFTREVAKEDHQDEKYSYSFVTLER